MSLIASIQMISTPRCADNLASVERLLLQAKNAGAKIALLPENFAMMAQEDAAVLSIKERLGEGPIQEFLSQQARKLGLWIIAGTIPIASEDPSKVYAACLIYDAAGERVARYDKIHLFDVELENEESYKESATMMAGSQPLVVETPFARIGIAICYDLRFPEMFRYLIDQGAELIAVMAAFTASTGAAHWECLLRARAIENLCYIAASNQGGLHENGRETFGNSMIIDPWGQIKSQVEQGEAVITAQIDRTSMQQTRKTFPCLQHRKIS